jgi:hypothetical protein
LTQVSSATCTIPAHPDLVKLLFHDYTGREGESSESHYMQNRTLVRYEGGYNILTKSQLAARTAFIGQTNGILTKLSL